MKRKLLVSCWSLVPVVLLAYHYGPGQTELARDAALQKIAAAQKLEQEENWRGAMEAYGEALAKMPSGEQAKRWQVRLA